MSRPGVPAWDAVLDTLEDVLRVLEDGLDGHRVESRAEVMVHRITDMINDAHEAQETRPTAENGGRAGLPATPAINMENGDG